MTPMRRLLSPGGIERCSSAVQEQATEETPLHPVGWAKEMDVHTELPTLNFTLHTLGVSYPLSKKF